MKPWSSDEIELYSKQFKNLEFLRGNSISEIIFYLSEKEINYSEQPNKYGKSLFNGIDIHFEGRTITIGSHFNNSFIGYGLNVEVGTCIDFEFVEREKRQTSFPAIIIGEQIQETKIYWKLPRSVGSYGFYPQEIEIISKNAYLLFSSIEITAGEFGTEFTNELLIIDNPLIARELKLGSFGILDNGRHYFESFEELKIEDSKNWP